MLKWFKNQDYWVFGLCQSSGVLKNIREHNVSEAGSVSVLIWGGERYLMTETDPISETLCSLEYRTMDKGWNSRNPDCHRPSSESFRIFSFKNVVPLELLINSRRTICSRNFKACSVRKYVTKTADIKSVCKMLVIIYKLHFYYNTTAILNMDFRVTHQTHFIHKNRLYL
jgi:hypothetical protein